MLKVVSTRLTQADYERVAAKRSELGLGWDQLLTEAVAGHYDLGLEGLPRQSNYSLQLWIRLKQEEEKGDSECRPG